MSNPILYKHFQQNVRDFSDFDAACDLAKELNLTIESSQRDAPVGLMFGVLTISKWRNMSPTELNDLHGTIEGDRRHGPVTILIRPHAPEVIRESFLALGGQETKLFGAQP